jgi:hypothetical protein
MLTSLMNPMVSVRSIKQFWIVLLAVIGLSLALCSIALADPVAAFQQAAGSDVTRAALAKGASCLAGLSAMDSADCAVHVAEQLKAQLRMHLAVDAVDEVTLTLPSNGVNLGDLVGLWGDPALRQYCQMTVASWPIRGITASVLADDFGQVDTLAPVSLLSFTGENTPQWASYLSSDALHFCGGVKTPKLSS